MSRSVVLNSSSAVLFGSPCSTVADVDCLPIPLDFGLVLGRPGLERSGLMDTQRLSIRGRTLESDDPSLQDALSAVYEAPVRPRCLCAPGGVEMYVAFHRRYLAKRMPDTGYQHHPACPSFEPSPQQSGLGELVGDAVLESEGAVELRVDFAWSLPCTWPTGSDRWA